MSFVHLHCHSEYSLLDGANRIDDLIARAKLYEQPALAITDHGNMHAAWEFQEKARKAGLKPIIGMEAYVAPGDRRTRGRPAPGAKPYYHLVLLARDMVGYRNLVKLSSLAYTEGFYSKPRVDRELLAKYHEGLIVSSACMAGEVASHLMEDRMAEAREAAAWYANLFDGRYYLEVQAHTSEGQAGLNAKVLGLADDLGLPVVATNDTHFLRHEDHDAHDVLLCIGLGKDRSDRDRMKYDDGLYFKNADEVRPFFPGRPDVLENTLAIADTVDVQFSKKYFVPSFPLPEGVDTENNLLVRLATDGAKMRYGETLRAEVQERLDYELDVITKTGYAGYFLIVWDFIKAARDLGIPVGPGRGSAAGSLVAYALRITDVCPLEFDLLFERFLNPERVSMPDVDVDFCFERRGEVIEYVRQKYGKDSVGQIVTFGTMKSRAAIKDVGRTLGFTPAETDALAKLIPNAPNFSLTVKEAVEQVPDVKRFYQDDDRYKQLLDYAIALEGLSRHTGVHAAGVVIAPGPLDEFVPICTQASKGSGAGDDERVIVTQYDMNALEKAGMLKMDFLGLTTLTVIDDTLKLIRERTGQSIVLEERGFTDPETYRVLRAGRTGGVFQFESPLATDLLKRMRCDRFDDLVASSALMRPGPLDAGMHNVYIRRKRGEEAVSYALPELEAILSTTYGVITYQEQVMRIAQVLAGISLAEADVLRKAVGKKDAELIRKELDKFTAKSIARGYDPKIVETLAGQIETFGRYGFNKSHSVVYSVLSYHTAWLKTHYPAEFMAALLSSQIGKTEDVIKYIAEAREMGIEVLAPDVNESGWRFTVVADKRIRFGLGAIRNVGKSAIDSLLSARNTGAFTSLADLCSRVDLRMCNKRVFEALIATGATDALGGHRAQLSAALDHAINEASLRQDEAAIGQGSLFGALLGDDTADASTTSHAPTPLPSVAPWSESERLQREKELLGFYISGHPLDPFRTECELFASHTVAQLGSWTPEPVTLGVVVTAIKRQVSKRNGAEFARLTVEDFSGSSEVLVFPEAWGVLAERVRPDIPLLLKGGYSRRDQDVDNPTFIVESVTRFAEIRASGDLAVAIDLARGADLPPSVMEDVRVTIELHQGSAPIELRWRDDGGQPVRFRSRTLTVAATPLVLSDLRAILGADRVRLVRTGGAPDRQRLHFVLLLMSATTVLDFERPIADLEKQIDELKKLAGERDIDVATEIAPLEKKLEELRVDVYRNLTPLQRVLVARIARRPFTADYIRLAFTDFIELHGDRAFRDDGAIIGGWARLEGETVMIIGHQRGRDTKENLRRNFGMPHPEGYRKALRHMKLAEKFQVPVLTFIDTPGAWPGLGAEERGQSEAIARNLFEMSQLQVPIIATVIGEGGSGGALALGVADRVIMLENAVYSVITVEGCASILWKDGKSPEMREKAASALRLTAQDLVELRVVDEVVPEPAGGAHADHATTANSLREALIRNLDELKRYKPDKLVRRRREKFLRMGQFAE